MDIWDLAAKKFKDDEYSGVLSWGAPTFYNSYLDNNQKNAVKRFLTTKKINRLLDFGCGDGRWTGWFSKFANNCTGIDTSVEMLKLANVKNRSDNINYLNKNIEYFKKNEFDTIFACYVLQHVTKDKELSNIINQFYEKSKNNSTLIILEICKKKERKIKDYITLRTTDSYKKLIEKEGYTLKNISGVNFNYLIYTFLFVLRKIYRMPRKYGDERDTAEFWKKIEFSHTKRIIYLLLRLTMTISLPLNFISKYVYFLSAEKVFVFEKIK